MSNPTALTVATIPPPQAIKAELIQLYRVVRLTRSLLKLSERVHSAVPKADTKPGETAGAA